MKWAKIGGLRNASPRASARVSYMLIDNFGSMFSFFIVYKSRLRYQHKEKYCLTIMLKHEGFNDSIIGFGEAEYYVERSVIASVDECSVSV